MRQYWGSRILVSICFVALVINICHYIWSFGADTFKPVEKAHPKTILSHKPKHLLPNVKNLAIITKYKSTPNSGDDDSNTNSGVPGSCPELPPGLGPMPAINETIANADQEYHFSEIKHGGYFHPGCKPVQSIAVVVPFHGELKKYEYVKIFVYYIHTFLMKQNVEYQLFTVQNSNKSAPYNRAQLFNIGFREAQLSRPAGWSCVVLHEPYLLPLDTRNLFWCGWYPRQLASRINDTARTPYVRDFGGAIAISQDQFKKVNGFPNTLIDDETKVYEGFLKRIETMNYAVECPPENFGRYTSLRNITKDKTESVVGRNPTMSYTSIAPTSARASFSFEDGLSSLLYRVDKNENHHLHCFISATIFN